MQLAGKFVDDFKTDRKGISPPLPVYLRLLPIVFYLTVFASILLNGLFVVRFGQATKLRDDLIARDRAVQADLTTAKKQRADLEGEAKKASDIGAWVEGSRPLQPLVVDIARSIEPGASIEELRMDRAAENPAQIRLSMHLGSDSPRQLDLTLAKISEQKFRLFSPQQTLVKGDINYKATMLWQDTRTQGTSPIPAPGP
ncbi:hypothetical protein BH09VER1_BH09VER1_09880 [soil metagenome]